MADSRTHPHIDMPSEEELTRLVEDKQPAVGGLYLDAHRLVLEAVPDVRYSVDCEDAEIGYGARQFGYDGWGMAAVTPYRRWVSVAFLGGAKLQDPERLFEGSGAMMRHVKIRTEEELAEKRVAIVRLLEAAARLNER